MPRMRHGLGDARDADGHERVPALVDLDRRPAKKGRKTKGSKRCPGAKAAEGHAARDAGEADAEMRWGAELVLQLALGGEVSPSASRDALAPRGEAPKRRLEDPNKRGAPPPSGASSEPIGAGRHVLVGDPIVVPSRRAASDGDIVRGPADLRLARGAGTDASALGLPTGPTLAKERRDQASDAFNSVAAAASQHAPLAPLRLAARAALPQAALRTPDNTHAGSKPGGDANSLCARILAARAAADDDDSCAPRGCPSRASTQTAHTAPGSRSHFPALEDSFAQAFRVLQNAATALVRAHAEAGADGQSTEARRSSSLADPASLLALLDSDQAAAARAVLEQFAHAGAGAGAGSDRGAEGHRTALTALDAPTATEAAHSPETTPARLRAPCSPQTRVKRDLSLAPAVARALASARGAGVFAPPPEVLAARTSPLEVLAARSSPPSAAGRSPFKRGRSSSAFRGVTLHRRTRRWESHIWVRETGKQLYLGGFDLERSAAEAHDLCALKLRGKQNVRGLNFPLSTYARANDALDRMSHEQVVAAVRAGRLTARGGFEGARNTDA
jgi:hypothetical protein